MPTPLQVAEHNLALAIFLREEAIASKNPTEIEKFIAISKQHFAIYSHIMKASAYNGTFINQLGAEGPHREFI